MLFFFSSILLFKFLENSRFHRLVTLWSRISCCQLGKHSSNVSRLFAHHCFPIYTHTWTNKKKRDHKSLLEINRKKKSTILHCSSLFITVRKPFLIALENSTLIRNEIFG